MNLITGTVDKDGGFVPALQQTAPLPVARRDLAGRTVVLGLRPEALRLAEPGRGDVRVTVDFIEELGASRVVHLDWAGQALAVVQTEPLTFTAGEPADLSVPADAAHFFDSESGLRLEAAKDVTGSTRIAALA